MELPNGAYLKFSKLRHAVDEVLRGGETRCIECHAPRDTSLRRRFMKNAPDAFRRLFAVFAEQRNASDDAIFEGDRQKFFRNLEHFGILDADLIRSARTYADEAGAILYSVDHEAVQIRDNNPLESVLGKR